MNKSLFCPSILYLLCIFTFIASATLSAQKSDSRSHSNSNPLSLAIGTVKTELKAAAIRLAVEYAEDLSGKGDKLLDSPFESTIIYFTPIINMNTGEKDALNGIAAKLTGFVLILRDTTIDGAITKNTKSFFHSLPISIGAESDNGFNRVNALAEVGYVPWYQAKVSKILQKTKIGVFVQGGYKFKIDDDSTSIVMGGGNVDESKEKGDSGLLRLKGSAGFRPEFSIGFIKGLKFGVVGNADGWYDIVNSEFYYRLEAAFRIILTQEKSFDFTYEKGSGAPNFNKGDQFSANLTIAF